MDLKDFTHSEQRIHPAMASHLALGDTRFDVHCHLFTQNYIPENYFHVRLPWLRDQTIIRRLIRLLRGRKLDDDTWTQHAADFLRVAKHEKMLDVAQELLAGDKHTFVFCPLMMDMTQAYGRANVRSMRDQMDEMREVRDRYPERVLPFVALDPNNPEMMDLFQKAFSTAYNFYGVKIYPILGYLPNHPKLMEVFELCELLKIPVTTHCGGNATRANGLHFKLPYRHYDALGDQVDLVQSISFRSEAEKGAYFNDPKRWAPVLERFPKLRLNLAHFGGEDAWEDFSQKKPNTWVHQIVQLMEAYEHVFTDVSFILHLTEKRNSSFIECFEELLNEKTIVRNRTLFGTDYYMLIIHEKLPLAIQNFLIRLDDGLVQKLVTDNPKKFLNLV